MIGRRRSHWSRPLRAGPGPRVVAATGAVVALVGCAAGAGAAGDLGGTPLAPRTKTAGCVGQGHGPDPACTPGAVLTRSRARVCVTGYTRTVRDVPYNLKRRVYREYGIRRHPRGTYEVDHLIALELGGGNDISNLWPQPAAPAPGFHGKDALENLLHARVCAGELNLAAAQARIARDWYGEWVAAGRP